MRHVKRSLLTTLILIGGYTYGQPVDSLFQSIERLIIQKSFIKAEKLFGQKQQQIPEAYQPYISACLTNAFNQLPDSEKNIDQALQLKARLPDSLLFHLYELRKDNAVKLYRYKEARNTVKLLLKEFHTSLQPEKIKDLQNDLALWSALANVPPQTITLQENTVLSIHQDKAGLKNIAVSNGKDSLDFIFDTGANISTITLSSARRMGMKIIPAHITVGAITGKEVSAQLAVCDKLLIGRMELNHVVFLVFDDADLAFPQIAYQINGIIGFPVIDAMKEIEITRDNYFKVPKTTSDKDITSNLALNGLTPVIFIDDKPFTFDTGADQTWLYQPYYLENKATIIRDYQPDSLNFGGAGGGRKISGYKIKTQLTISGKPVLLDSVGVTTTIINEHIGIYGNIGQDVIQQFRSMTLNFDKMFIRFE